MTEMMAQQFNWKFNRFLLPLFYTNSFQQDYALNVIQLGWLEDGILLDVNNTSVPQPKWPVEVVRYLPETSAQYGRPGQVCWLPNNQMIYGTWGAPNVGTGSGAFSPNPQPNQPIGTPIGVTAMPNNPLLQVADAFGNYWIVTGFGTTGSSNPFATNLNPVYPTPANPTTTATTATDGTVTWTAVNPYGMGIRCSPIPPQTGIIYQFRLVGQWRALTFTNGPFTAFEQTIEPIPDDFSKYFRDGFVAMAYAHSPDKAARGKFQDMHNMWMKALMDAKTQGDRERDNNGFYPSTPIMSPSGFPEISVAYPWPLY